MRQTLLRGPMPDNQKLIEQQWDVFAARATGATPDELASMRPVYFAGAGALLATMLMALSGGGDLDVVVDELMVSLAAELQGFITANGVRVVPVP